MVIIFGLGHYKCKFTLADENKDFKISGDVRGIEYESPQVDLTGHTMNVTLNFKSTE